MRTEILSEQPAGQHERPAAPRRVSHRSRSSPSRAVLSPPSTRQRSPSASPDRHTRLQASQQVLPPCAVGSAYFSPRPPAVPLRLVVRGPPAPVASPASLDGPASSRIAARRRRVVKKLLRELVAALPLPTAPAAPTAAARPVTTRTSPAVPPDVRDAAVQAITMSNAESGGRQKPDERHAGIKSEGEEWVGGVRALRDSHVRLVLRQLRHIERLNRALDRAARPDAGLCVLPPAQTAAPRLPH